MEDSSVDCLGDRETTKISTAMGNNRSMVAVHVPCALFFLLSQFDGHIRLEELFVGDVFCDLFVGGRTKSVESRLLISSL